MRKFLNGVDINKMPGPARFCQKVSEEERISSAQVPTLAILWPAKMVDNLLCISIQMEMQWLLQYGDRYAPSAHFRCENQQSEGANKRQFAQMRILNCKLIVVVTLLACLSEGNCPGFQAKNRT